MALRDILLHLDLTERCAERTQFAARLAERHQAHLTGMVLLDLPRQTMPHGDEVGRLYEGTLGLTAQLRARVMPEVDATRARFEDAVRPHGIVAEWRKAEGDAAKILAEQARYADLIVIGQPDPGAPDRTLAHEVSATTLLASGRPVMSLPYAGHFAPPERHALVGWNGSREAARAVNDALPLLEHCDHVTVLAINPTHTPGLPNENDMCEHLRRHGINAEAAQRVVSGTDEGQALLSHAADLGADLIVMGAWGHSRLREWAFGGATRTILASMTAPIFMSS